MNIRLADNNTFVFNSAVDGPGLRNVVFMKGCTLACPGCQSQHLWPATGGTHMDTLSVAQKLLSNETRRITITGGEPFQQADALKDLVFDLNAIAPVEIIVYTGYDWKELFERFPQALLFLREYDVILVTGRFVRELDNPFIQWRGSTNQVPIYLGAMASIWGEPYVLNWDTIEIDPANDNLYLPVGVAQLFSELFGSESDATRRCGQNKF